MHPGRASYAPSYSNSHALIVGISAYQRVGKLLYATNDATAVADVLIRRFGFPEETSPSSSTRPRR